MKNQTIGNWKHFLERGKARQGRGGQDRIRLGRVGKGTVGQIRVTKVK